MKRRILAAVVIGMMITSVSANAVPAASVESNVESFAEAPLMGGWALPDELSMTAEAEAAFANAIATLTGVDYEPLFLLGTQIVAGTNYSILCKATGVYPGATTGYAILYIYQDLEGNAEILRIQNLELSASEPVEEYAINITSGKDLIVECPESAAAGELVQISTFCVSDATLTLEVSGEDVVAVSEGVYEFEMPDHAVDVSVDFEVDENGA